MDMVSFLKGQAPELQRKWHHQASFYTKIFPIPLTKDAFTFEGSAVPQEPPFPRSRSVPLATLRGILDSVFTLPSSHAARKDVSTSLEISFFVVHQGWSLPRAVIRIPSFKPEPFGLTGHYVGSIKWKITSCHGSLVHLLKGNLLGTPQIRHQIL